MPRHSSVGSKSSGREGEAPPSWSVVGQEKRPLLQTKDELAQPHSPVRRRSHQVITSLCPGTHRHANGRRAASPITTILAWPRSDRRPHRGTATRRVRNRWDSGSRQKRYGFNRHTSAERVRCHSRVVATVQPATQASPAASIAKPSTLSLTFPRSAAKFRPHAGRHDCYMSRLLGPAIAKEVRPCGPPPTAAPGGAGELPGQPRDSAHDLVIDAASLMLINECSLMRH